MYLNVFKLLKVKNNEFCRFLSLLKVKILSPGAFKQEISSGGYILLHLFFSFLRLRGSGIISSMEKSIGMQDIAFPPCPYRTLESMQTWVHLRECLHALCNTTLPLQGMFLPTGMKQSATHSGNLSDCSYRREDALQMVRQNLLPIFSLFPPLRKKGGE